MKVIEKGSTNWSYKFKCKGCGAVLEAEAEDVKYIVSDALAYAKQYDVDVEGEFVVECPECGESTKIKQIPPTIKEQIKNS